MTSRVKSYKRIQAGENEPLIPRVTTGFPGAVVGILIVVGIGLLAWAITMTALFSQRESPRCTRMCGDMLIYCDEYCVTDIIVGGGTTGLSVANRLSQNLTRDVLVLESGGDYPNELYANDMGDGLRWEVVWLTDPYRYYHMLLSKQQQSAYDMIIMEGNVLGGSSSINDAFQFRGSIDFWNSLDTWMGSTGKFAGDNVYEIFKQFEWLKPSPVYIPDSTRSMTQNAWKLEVLPRVDNPNDDYHTIASLFSSAFGIPNAGALKLGPNDPLATVGAFPYTDMLHDFNATVNPAIRWSSRKAFLNSTVMDQTTYAGPRIRVLIRSPVQKLLFHPLDPTRVVGVEYLDSNKVCKRAFATQNVVLSTWHFDAPILQRSGIGPASVLAEAGITPRVINEHVGRNWKIHPIVALAFLYPNMTGVTNPEDGIFNSGAMNTFVQDSVLGTPNQRGFHLISVSYPYVLAFFDFQLRAQTTGTISVYSDDPMQHAKYDPNLYGNPVDLLSFRTHLRSIVPDLLASDPNIISLSLDNTTLYDDDLLNAWIVENTIINSPTHSYGSVRVGTGPSNGAIDIDFKVFGAKNLRVCDSSVFPDPTDANPSLSCAGLGQICALSMLGLPVPTGAKKKFMPKLPFAKAKKNVPPPKKRSMNDLQMYEAIVNYFNQVKATTPANADQIIAAIQKNEPWKSLEAQFGPYMHSGPAKKQF